MGVWTPVWERAIQTRSSSSSYAKTLLVTEKWDQLGVKIEKLLELLEPGEL